MNPERGNTLWQGLVAGLVGYAVTVVLGFFADLAAGGPPFYTPALLGSAFFYGLREPGGMEVSPGPVLAYNGFHLVLFLALGTFASWLAHVAERGQAMWYVAVSLFLFVFLHVQGLMLFATEKVRSELSAVGMWVVAVLAVVAMGGYLVWAHPKLRRQLARGDDEETGADVAPGTEEAAHPTLPQGQGSVR